MTELELELEVFLSKHEHLREYQFILMKNMEDIESPIVRQLYLMTAIFRNLRKQQEAYRAILSKQALVTAKVLKFERKV